MKEWNTFQKLPKSCFKFGQCGTKNVATGFKKIAQMKINRPILSHCQWPYHLKVYEYDKNSHSVFWRFRINLQMKFNVPMGQINHFFHFRRLMQIFVCPTEQWASTFPGIDCPNSTNPTLKIYFRTNRPFENGVFEHLFDLEIIDLSRNKLSELPENLFENLSRLQSLILSENRLQFVRIEWFEPLTNLYRLDLSYNPLGMRSQLS